MGAASVGEMHHPCLCACGKVLATSKAADVGGIRRCHVCLGMMTRRVNDGEDIFPPSPSCSNTWGSRKDGEGGSNPSPSHSNGCEKTYGAEKTARMGVIPPILAVTFK